jgi:hypothetical protein
MNSDRVAKLLFTAMSVVLMALGVAAILMESHTGIDKRGHVVALQGEQAVWMGQTLILLAVPGVVPEWVGLRVPRVGLRWVVRWVRLAERVRWQERKWASGWERS